MTPEFNKIRGVPYGEIKVMISNGGMNKEAFVLIKQGRKVLELRALASTAYMGQPVQETFEAILWSGHALRSGAGVSDLTAFETEKARLIEAAKFTPEEFEKARR